MLLIIQLDTLVENIEWRSALIKIQKCYKNYNDLHKSSEQKTQCSKKVSVLKPVISHEMNSRSQVDLVDTQPQADGDYTFTLVYQNHLTR